MPFYEYECSACNHYLEALQKISDPPLRKCPNCKKSKLKRLVSAPVFRLKGSGWYETDFKSDREEKRNLADRDDAPESTSTDSKSDTASDTGSKSGSKRDSGKVVSISKGAAARQAKQAKQATPAKQAKSAKPAKRPAAATKAKKTAARPAARKKVARR